MCVLFLPLGVALVSGSHHVPAITHSPQKGELQTGFGAGSQQNARGCLRGGSSQMARMLLAFHMHILGLIFFFFPEVLSACISCGLQPAFLLSRSHLFSVPLFLSFLNFFKLGPRAWKLGDYVIDPCGGGNGGRVSTSGGVPCRVAVCAEPLKERLCN